MTSVRIYGAGIVGLWQARLFLRAGFDVEIIDAGGRDLAHSCSYWAGGMLAPWCEQEVAEPIINRLGQVSLSLWEQSGLLQKRQGTLVVAHARDRAELDRFGVRTTTHRWVDSTQIAQLEPDLEGRFARGLFFAQEAAVDPRQILPLMIAYLEQNGARLQFDAGEVEIDQPVDGWAIDARGLGAKKDLEALRGVKGEAVIIQSCEINLSRSVRFLHPRYPLYIVPRGAGTYLIGASSIETQGSERVSVRGMLDLLSAAFALHPGFGEAEIVEQGARLRPAFAHNEPKIILQDRVLRVNGLYRHGYLLAPALAAQCVDYVQTGTKDAELMVCAYG